ncbi:MAG: amidohydrolase family protein [Streptosporangiaceae bacterium]
MLDSHVHLWDLGVRDQAWISAGSPLRRSFDVGDLRAALAGTPVDGVILVQASNDVGETTDLISCAWREDLIRGVVGWADLRSPDFPGALATLTATGELLGLRHQALAEADPAGWLRSPAVRRGLAVLQTAGLPFDLMIRPAHFPAALRTVREHPALQFVLDHLGKPPIASGELEPWAAGIRSLAAEPNVACKLSGLQTIASAAWTRAELAPYVDVALDAFGPGRLIFGSDWPVCTPAASYSRVCQVAQSACSGLSAPERAAVLAGNARAVYRTHCPQPPRPILYES